jgi:TRAP-type C4-dicarboxylate transport system substrate-binding protein
VKLAFVVALLAGTLAHAEPVVLRVATPAPEGSGWAREGLAFKRDVEQLTNGRVKVKLYFGGITGDELQSLDQIHRGRVDMIASGGPACVQLAPTMRVFGVLGMFQGRDEAVYITGRLKSSLDEEFLKSGFINLGEVSVGPEIPFTRSPARSLSDLKKQTLWYWDIDQVTGFELKAMGLRASGLPVHEAWRAFDGGKIDGFVAVPAATLAFQWSSQARYMSDMHLGVLRGCLLVAARWYDALSTEDQKAMLAAGAKAAARLDEVAGQMDEALLGGLFVKQGMTTIKISAGDRAEILDATRTARDKLPESLVSKALIARVLGYLADYRAEHQRR